MEEMKVTVGMDEIKEIIIARMTSMDIFRRKF